MKRLTGRSKYSGAAFYPYCFRADTCGGEGCHDGECKFIEEVCERLAKYEDTGLSPKQVRKMKKKMEEREDG